MPLLLGTLLVVLLLVAVVFGGVLGALFSDGRSGSACAASSRPSVTAAPADRHGAARTAVPERGHRTARPSVSADPCAVTVALPKGAVAARVVSYARAQLGKPYVWGAEGPDAFDCSGLTMAAYRAAGITIPRVSGDQWRHLPHVLRGQEQPGDLVFFNTGPGTSPDNPGHVGIVIGDGKMIAAPNSTTVVQVQPYARPSLIGFARPAT